MLIQPIIVQVCQPYASVPLLSPLEFSYSAQLHCFAPEYLPSLIRDVFHFWLGMTSSSGLHILRLHLIELFLSFCPCVVRRSCDIELYVQTSRFLPLGSRPWHSVWHHR